MFNKSNTILKYVTVLVVVCTIFLGGGEKGQVNAATQEISLKKSAVSDNKSVKIVNKKKILYTDTWISLGVKLNEKKVKSNQLIWESSDSNIATISKKGKVSAKTLPSDIIPGKQTKYNIWNTCFQKKHEDTLLHRIVMSSHLH